MNIEVANRLVQLRKQCGYSQEDLAEKLGVSRQAVSKWERAESSPDTDNLIRLARLYRVSLDNLLNITDELPPPPAPPPDNSGQGEAYDCEEEAEFEDYDEWEHREISVPWKILDGAMPILVLALFLFAGFGLDLWHPAWAVFLLIPIYYIVSTALKNGGSVYKAILDGAFPLIIVALYILLGLFGVWHPTWLLFLLIPIYYIISDAVKK
ncbi:MAG: helix-turn-helix domain-containing protein [Oscillospiraceae bacterium]|jgi:transcriptional regulator with XRE-family HTH domain|nr:helix-turn-helix domain-containing protein [Oscillospiraceae bacterium]